MNNTTRKKYLKRRMKIRKAKIAERRRKKRLKEWRKLKLLQLKNYQNK